MGVAGRIKLTKRVALNAEYFYVLPDQLARAHRRPNWPSTRTPGYTDSFSIGFDIETGGHVFQLHFTNSTGMFERAFITETTGSWMRRRHPLTGSTSHACSPCTRRRSRQTGGARG